MRKKQLITALILMAVLGVISWMTRDKSTGSDVKVGDLVFNGIDVSKISRVHIVTPNQSETEIYSKNKKWVLKERYDMDADPSVVRNLMTVLGKAKAIQVVPFKEEDLNLFLLDKNATVMKVYQEGSDQPLTFKFGKFHQFSQQGQGRYVYIKEKDSVVLLSGRYDFVTGHQSVWLKKYLPYQEQVASVSLFYDGTILWKSQRQSSKSNFMMVQPKNSKLNKMQIKNLIESALYMRYMDITPAVNDFEPDKEYQKVNLVFQTFAGRAYELNFLKKDKNFVRCTLKLIDAKVKTDFIKEYGSVEALREEISEWHFLVPFLSYQNLFKMN